MLDDLRHRCAALIKASHAMSNSRFIISKSRPLLFVQDPAVADHSHSEGHHRRKRSVPKQRHIRSAHDSGTTKETPAVVRTAGQPPQPLPLHDPLVNRHQPAACHGHDADHDEGVHEPSSESEAGEQADESPHPLKNILPSRLRERPAPAVFYSPPVDAPARRTPADAPARPDAPAG